MPCVWTPLPPSRSGIANYAGALYDNNDVFGDLDFIVSDPCERGHPRAFGPDEAPAEQAHTLLQVGNNIYHDYIYERAQRGGCIVEMHDLSLHHLHTEVTLGRGDFIGYRKGLEECEGEWGRRFAYQRSKGFYTQHLEFHTRMNRKVTECATALIVHSHWAKQQLELQGCETPIYVVPHYALTPEASPAKTSSREAARVQLGLADDAFVILSAGYVTRAKRVEWTLAAFETLAAENPKAVLVIAGEVLPDVLGARLADSPFRDRIVLTGYLSDADFCDYTLAADVLPVMRFPSAGESSGVIARAMGFGRLVIAPELMAFSDLDDRYVDKVELDRDPVQQLTAILRAHAADLPALRKREQDIARFARQHLALEDLRKDVAEILRWHWT
ncbi:MAG: glycosyltransferase [Pikeienuella sp.]